MFNPSSKILSFIIWIYWIKNILQKIRCTSICRLFVLFDRIKYRIEKVRQFKEANLKSLYLCFYAQVSISMTSYNDFYFTNFMILSFDEKSFQNPVILDIYCSHFISFN